MTSMPRRRGGLRPLALVVAGLMLTACGSARPGVAAQVGDRSISVSEVDRAALAVCALVEKRAEQEGSSQAFAMRGVREALLAGMISHALADQLAEEYAVEPGQDYVQSLSDLRAQYADATEEQRAAYVDYLSAAPYRQAVVEAAAVASLQAEGVSSPSEDQLTGRGNLLVARWAADHEINVDPRFGLAVTDGVVEEAADEALAFALSSAAKSGGLTGSELTPDYAQTLPRSQRCGS